MSVECFSTLPAATLAATFRRSSPRDERSCYITLERIADVEHAVVASDGNAYSAVALQAWVRSQSQQHWPPHVIPGRPIVRVERCAESTPRRGGLCEVQVVKRARGRWLRWARRTSRVVALAALSGMARQKRAAHGACLRAWKELQRIASRTARATGRVVRDVTDRAVLKLSGVCKKYARVPLRERRRACDASTQTPQAMPAMPAAETEVRDAPPQPAPRSPSLPLARQPSRSAFRPPRGPCTLRVSGQSSESAFHRVAESSRSSRRSPVGIPYRRAAPPRAACLRFAAACE